MENINVKLIIGLHRNVNQIDKMTANLVREYNITLSQFSVLEVLYSKGPMCIGDIKEKILSSTGTIPVIISNLEKIDLIERKAVPNDKRFSMIHLTKKGKELIEDILPRNEVLLKEYFSGLSEVDKNDLLNLLKKLSKKE